MRGINGIIKHIVKIGGLLQFTVKLRNIPLVERFTGCHKCPTRCFNGFSGVYGFLLCCDADNGATVVTFFHYGFLRFCFKNFC